MSIRKNTKVFAVVLVIVMFLQPFSAFAQQRGDDEEIAQINALLDQSMMEYEELYPDGLVSFFTPAYTVRRDAGSFDIYILRLGGVSGEMRVDLSVMDINATYGKDYVIKTGGGLFDPGAVERLPEGMQLLPTEDLDEEGKVVLKDADDSGGDEGGENASDESAQGKESGEPEQADEADDVEAFIESLESIVEDIAPHIENDVKNGDEDDDESGSDDADKTGRKDETDFGDNGGEDITLEKDGDDGDDSKSLSDETGILNNKPEDEPDPEAYEKSLELKPVEMNWPEASQLSREPSLSEIKSLLWNKEIEPHNYYPDESEGSSDSQLYDLTAFLQETILPSAEFSVYFEDGERYKAITVDILSGTSASDETFTIHINHVEKTDQGYREFTGVRGAAADMEAPQPQVGDLDSVSVILKHDGEIQQSIIGFEERIIYANPNSGSAEIVVERTEGIYNTSIVYFSTKSDTALPGKDYMPVQTSLLFMPGDTRKTVDVPIMSGLNDVVFQAVLSEPEGASLHSSEIDVVIENTPGLMSGSSGNPLHEEIDVTRMLTEYKTVGSYAKVEDSEFQIGGNKIAGGFDNRNYYSIAKYKDTIPTAAYQKVEVEFRSDAMLDNWWGSFRYSWNDRFANTLTMSLWKDNGGGYIYVPGKSDTESTVESQYLYNRWQHPGSLSRSENMTRSLEIPNSFNTSASLLFQQQHIKDYISKGRISIKEVTLTKRLINFRFLNHDPFIRRVGSLNNTESVHNLFTIEPNTGKGENSTYVIGDQMTYLSVPAAQDELYAYMTTLARYGVSDRILKNASDTGMDISGNHSFLMDKGFFETYGNCLNQHGNDQKVAYIKPAYNKEALKADIELKQSPDGSAEIGFLNDGNMESLAEYPAYLSEYVTLKAQPDQARFYSGYKLEYKDYNGFDQVRYEFVGKDQIREGTVDTQIKVEYKEMAVTPIFSPKTETYIEIAVDEETRRHGVSFQEGIIDAYTDAEGSREEEIRLGQIITLYAIAQEGFVPVWTLDGQEYCGNALDFLIEQNVTNISLKFVSENVINHSITGKVEAPRVTINTIQAQDYGRSADTPKEPRVDVSVASGFAGTGTDEDGVFVLKPEDDFLTGKLLSVKGTKRTIKLTDGGETSIYTLDIPSGDGDSGTVIDAGTIELSVSRYLPYLIFGTVFYTNIDASGTAVDYTSSFGGPALSDLKRYDSTLAEGHIYFPDIEKFSDCIVSFHRNDGSIITSVDAVRRDYRYAFNFHAFKDTSEHGRMSITLRDTNGYIYGPYDAGIDFVNPPSGDIDLVEGPEIEIPVVEMELPIVKLMKPNFSAGAFQPNFTENGLEIIVGFDAKKLYDEYQKAQKEAKEEEEKRSGKDKAKDAAEAAKEELKNNDKPTDQGEATGTTDKSNSKGSIKLKKLEFACKISFAYFDEGGKVVAKGTEGATLAVYDVLFYLGGEVEAKGEIPFTIYVVPCYASLTADVSAAVMVNLYAEGDDGKRSHFPLSTFNENPTDLHAEGLVPVGIKLTPAVGVGKKAIAALEVGGTFGFDFEWYPWSGGGTGKGSIDVFAAVYVLGMQFKAPFHALDYDMFDTRANGLMMAGTAMERETITYQNALSEGNLFPLRAFGDSQVVEGTLLGQVLHDTEHKIEDIGDGKMMAVFLTADNERDGVNQTALHYAIIDGTNTDSWETGIIHDDGSLDASPDILDIGDKVYIVWANAARDDLDDNNDMRDILSEFEISSVYYDKASGLFSNICAVTNDSERFEESGGDLQYAYSNVHPRLTYNEKTGRLFVYYIKEDFNHTAGDEEETVADFLNGMSTMAYMELKPDTNQPIIDYPLEEDMPEYIADLLYGQYLVDTGIMSSGPLSSPKIEEFAVSDEGAYTVLAYVLDLDQNAETTEDSELFIVLYDHDTHRTYNPISISQQPGVVGKPLFTKREIEEQGISRSNYELTWLENGKLYYLDMDAFLTRSLEPAGEFYRLDDSFGPVEYPAPQDEELPVNAGVLLASDGNDGMYLISTKSVGANVEIFARYFNGSAVLNQTEDFDGGAMHELHHEGIWSQDVQITGGTFDDSAQQRIILKDIVVSGDGTAYVLYDCFESGQPLGELKVLQISPGAFIDPDVQVCFDRDYPKAGEEVGVQALIRSRGLLPSENVPVSITADVGGSQDIIYSGYVDIPAGGSTSVPAEWTLPEEIEEGGIKIMVEAPGVSHEEPLPTRRMAMVSEASYNWFHSAEEKDIIDVHALIRNLGNLDMSQLTVQVCEVDTDMLHRIITDEDADVEDCYTELASWIEEDGFAHSGSFSTAFQVELDANPERPIREIMIRLFDKDSNVIGGSQLYLTIHPQAEATALESPKVDEKRSSRSGSGTGTYKITFEYRDEEDLLIKSEEKRFAVNTVLNETNLNIPEGYVLKESGFTHTVTKEETLIIPVRVKPLSDAEKPFISGYPDGTFGPNAEITRAEAMQMLYGLFSDNDDADRDSPNTEDDSGRASGRESGYQEEFTDLNQEHWGIDAVTWSLDNGLLFGYEDGTLKLDRNITRGELAALLSRVDEKYGPAERQETAGLRSFADVEGHWASANIAQLAGMGVITGYEDGTFKPDRPVTRAETVMMAAKLTGRSTVFIPEKFFTDVPESHWAYNVIMNAVNGNQ